MSEQEEFIKKLRVKANIRTGEYIGWNNDKELMFKAAYIIEQQAEEIAALRGFAKHIIDYSDLEKSWVDNIAVRYGLLIEKNDPLKKFYETKLLTGEE